MSKFKAKLTALLMAAGCCATGIGVGVSMKQADNVVVKADATALEAEFTNNGQFTLSKPSSSYGGGSSHTYSVIDGSTEEGLPEGYSGAVLKISGTTSYDFIKLDFISFPIFNVADICICTGTVMLAAAYLIYDNKTRSNNA